MKTTEFQDSEDIKKLRGLQCPTIFDKENFGKARNILIRVWSGKVSASMSGIEYYADEVKWMMERC